MGNFVPKTKTRPLSTHDDPLYGCYDLFNSCNVQLSEPLSYLL